MKKKKFESPCIGQAIEIRLEEDFLQGASAVGLVLATGQGVEELDNWEDTPWD